jgi:hypothetical protein
VSVRLARRCARPQRQSCRVIRRSHLRVVPPVS